MTKSLISIWAGTNLPLSQRWVILKLDFSCWLWDNFSRWERCDQHGFYRQSILDGTCYNCLKEMQPLAEVMEMLVEQVSLKKIEQFWRENIKLVFEIMDDIRGWRKW